MIAQQVPDFVNEQRGILVDRVRRQPGLVVVEAPVRIDRHGRDQVRFYRYEIEERGSEIGALVRRAQPGRLEVP